VVDTERFQRVRDGGDERRRPGDGRRLADALHADGVVRTRRDGVVRHEVRQLGRLGHRVLVHAARLQVAVLVVGRALEQRRADALGDAAVDLPLDDERVDDLPAVVDADVLLDLYLGGLRVDLDDRDVRPEREREVLRVVEVRHLQAGVHLVGQVVAEVRLVGDALDVHRPVGRARDLELAVLELDVVDARLQLVGGDAARFSRTSRAPRAMAPPPTDALRLPYVPIPAGCGRCRPMTSTSSSETPSSSAAIWAYVVRWPCPGRPSRRAR